MTTALAVPSSLGKISRNRMIMQSRARGKVARRDGLPEYLEPADVNAMLEMAPHGQAALMMVI